MRTPRREPWGTLAFKGELLLQMHIQLLEGVQVRAPRILELTPSRAKKTRHLPPPLVQQGGSDLGGEGYPPPPYHVERCWCLGQGTQEVGQKKLYPEMGTNYKKTRDICSEDPGPHQPCLLTPRPGCSPVQGCVRGGGLGGHRGCSLWARARTWSVSPASGDSPSGQAVVLLFCIFILLQKILVFILF